MTRLCRLFAVTRAGFYAWQRRPMSARRRQGRDLLEGDVIYLAVGGRWWYLIVVLDQCSRRVLAWRLAATRDSSVTRAVLDASEVAAVSGKREP